MSRKINFGKVKKQAKKDNTGIDVTDIVNNHLDSYEAKMIAMQEEINGLKKYQNLASEYVSEIEALQQNNEQLMYQVTLKTQDIESSLQIIQKQKFEVEKQAERILELEKQLKAKKPIDTRVTKKPLENDIVSDMQEFALSILDTEGDFFRKIAEKFKISKSTAYRYCKDIRNSNKVNE